MRSNTSTRDEQTRQKQIRVMPMGRYADVIARENSGHGISLHCIYEYASKMNDILLTYVPKSHRRRNQIHTHTHTPELCELDDCGRNVPLSRATCNNSATLPCSTTSSLSTAEMRSFAALSSRVNARLRALRPVTLYLRLVTSSTAASRSLAATSRSRFRCNSS